MLPTRCYEATAVAFSSVREDLETMSGEPPGPLSRMKARRARLGEVEGLLAQLSPAATVVSPDRERSATFDREGRLVFYSERGRTYKRSLASELHLRYRQGGRRRERLDPEQAREIFDRAYRMAAEVMPSAAADLRARLDKEILPWTPDRLAAEVRRFQAVYKPISILPPDQYLAVVLQATEGCTWNRCTFCNFYMDRPFAVRSPQEFARHARGVRRFLGRGLRLRRGIFLADGNALALSRARLEPLLEVATQEFPGRKLYGFVDLYSGERRHAEDWRELGKWGLERVYIGMETGLDELLELVNKPGSRAELEVFVNSLKTAGLRVCLIVMVGLGGREYRERHARATLEALESMPLGSGDLVYLSPFIEHGGSAYQERRLAAGLSPMSEGEVAAEVERLAGEVRRLGLKASRYDIREFVY